MGARVLPLLVRHLRQAAGPRAQDQGRDLDLLGPDLEATDDHLEPLVFSGPSLKEALGAWRSSRVLSSRLWTKSLRALTCCGEKTGNVNVLCVARDARVCEVCVHAVANIRLRIIVI